MEFIQDWAQIVMVCPCFVQKREIDKPSFVMNQVYRNIQYTCKNPECHNFFDYDVKVRLVELLNQYYEQHHTLEGFYKYVERKKERIRLRYLKNLDISKENNFIIIEVANLTRNPQYKLNDEHH